MNDVFHRQIEYAKTAPKFNPAGAAERRVWVYLVMLKDHFAAGAAVSARSLRERGTAYPIWCMCAGVSNACVEFLRGQFDNVIMVPLITHDHVDSPGMKKSAGYTSWTRHSFTKAHIVDPDLFPFDKVMLLDADSFMVSSADHLFNVTAPAMTFSSPWVAPYSTVKGKKPPMDNVYGEIDHGGGVTRGMIDAGLARANVGIASMVLVRPSIEYKAIRDKLLEKSGQYGHGGCFSGPDEQLFAEIFLTAVALVDVPEPDGIVAYHIHQIYNWNVGKVEWLPPGSRAQGMVQFFITRSGSYPWLSVIGGGNVFDDLVIWWYYAADLIREGPFADFFAAEPTIAAAFAAKADNTVIRHFAAVRALTSSVLDINLVKSAAKSIMQSCSRTHTRVRPAPHVQARVDKIAYAHAHAHVSTDTNVAKWSKGTRAQKKI